MIYLNAPAEDLIGSELRVTSLQGEIQEFFIGVGGGPNFGSEKTVEIFCAKLLPPHPLPLVTEKAETTTCFSICESQLPLAREIHRLPRVPTDNHIFDQLNSDIQSYRYKDFSLTQVSGLMGGGGGGSGPPDLPPWIHHCFGAL